MLPYLLLGGAQLAVGAAAIFARFALGGAQPIAVAAARLTVAALVLLLAAAVRPSRTKLEPRARVILFFAGIAMAIHFATWIGSLDFTNIAVSTLLVTTTPIWTAAYDAIVLRRGLSQPALYAFIAGGVGLVMVVGFDRTPPPFRGHDLLGAGLALAGAVAIGAYFTLVREVRNDLTTRTIVTHTYAWAALGLLLAALTAHQPLPAASAVGAWGGILAMALVSQLLGHTALNAALRWFSPSAVAFATLLEPAIAAALALAIFHEAVPPLAIAGGVILLGAIGVVLREDRTGFGTEM
ncbi:MAG: DMT family transporter [Vulcanimicrobiaceae bacterium]